MPIHSSALDPNAPDLRMAFALILLFGIVLAAGHLLSWNIEFVNVEGRTLWRACSLCILVSVILFTFGFLLPDRLQHMHVSSSSRWSTMLNITKGLSIFVTVVPYVIARSILIYLTIHSFSDLPAEVYDDIDWLQYIPFFH